MSPLQRRVLVEAELLFYLVGYPGMFSVNIKDTEPHIWVRQVPTDELLRVNAEARARLRSGSLAIRPQPPIKVVVSTTAVTP